jgi:hypothetical protein
MREHRVKTVNPHFQNVWEGSKTFELRKDDRNYCVGDILLLKEYYPESDSYSCRSIRCKVSHTLRHEDFFAVTEGWVILSIIITERLGCTKIY